ncbi:hypothetical protein [uncultured Pleomorphomonas sp.]|uniref:hypothetical protein n=1 Tax=uncultured Pleomorphomonas sp. TaxID=442121 RepID=UPI00258E09D7|nr:hypothetical protein [uncultured Pleomorphomonas sp.]
MAKLMPIATLIILNLWIFGTKAALADTASGPWPEEKVSSANGLMPDELVHKFIDLFRSACRPLGNLDVWKNDVDMVEAHAELDYIDAHNSIGWKARVRIGVKLKSNLSRLPNYTPDTGVIAGQTLWYDAGFPGKQGFFAYKRSSQFVCGMKPIGDQQFRYVTWIPW